MNTINPWTRPQTSLLITLWEKYSWLYDTQHPDYINKIKRGKSYQAICDSLNKIRKDVTIRDIKSKMRVLRGQYSREKRALACSKKDGEVYKPKLWCYEYLRFLDASSDGDSSRTSNLNSSTVKSPSVDYSSDDDNDDDHSSENAVVPPKKRKVRELEERAASALNFAQTYAERQPDGTEDLFCKYLSAEIKNIKLDHILRKLKMDLLTVVCDAIQNDREEREFGFK